MDYDKIKNENTIGDTVMSNEEKVLKDNGINDFDDPVNIAGKDFGVDKDSAGRKARKWGKAALAVMLIIGLTAGTTIGYLADRIIDEVQGKSTVHAMEEQQTNYIIDKTVSPVVPIAKKVLPSIVAIKIKQTYRDFFGQLYDSEGTGSGIIIDGEGHIATNNHVVENSNDIIVVLNNGKELPAKVIGKDAATDLAVIKVEEKNLPYAELGDSSKLDVGELAVAVGSPMGTDFAGSVTAGIISGLNRKVPIGERTMTLIQTDAAINPGNSGGALVNSEGKVIGINTIKFAESRVEGMGFAIPINEAKPIIKQLIENKKVSRPMLGIQGQTLDKATADQYKVPQGVVVVSVTPGSGAEKAGLVRGDIITKIDDKQIYTIEEVVEIVGKCKVGDTLKVEAYGSVISRYRTIEIKLTEKQN
ncbi:MAG: trypsin-like serine protease [Clostridiales bacterium]|nr:trypsin-like serine protease [Clostridiales bacterium]